MAFFAKDPRAGMMLGESSSNALPRSPLTQELFAGGGERTTGADVRQENVTACAAVAQVLKSSLGPVGLDKSPFRTQLLYRAGADEFDWCSDGRRYRGRHDQQ